MLEPSLQNPPCQGHQQQQQQKNTLPKKTFIQMLACKSVSEVHNDDTQQSCLSVCQKIYFTLLQ
jgi:hypothetical protein